MFHFRGYIGHAEAICGFYLDDSGNIIQSQGVLIMKMTGTNRLTGMFNKAEDHRICPECGNRMGEVDRVSEGNAVFIWYECGSEGCSGQWLQKILQPSAGVPKYATGFSGDLAAAS